MIRRHQHRHLVSTPNRQGTLAARPRIDLTRHYGEAAARGVSVWEDPHLGKQGPCLRRIFTGTLDRASSRSTQ